LYLLKRDGLDDYGPHSGVVNELRTMS
jgi:hypothetical protein